MDLTVAWRALFMLVTFYLSSVNANNSTEKSQTPTINATLTAFSRTVVTQTTVMPTSCNPDILTTLALLKYKFLTTANSSVISFK